MGNRTSHAHKSKRSEEEENTLKKKFDSLKDHEHGITREFFVKTLGLPLPSESAFAHTTNVIAEKWLKRHEGAFGEMGDDTYLSWDHFSLLVHDVEVQTAAEFMFALFQNEEECITKEDVTMMFNLARLHALSLYHDKEDALVAFENGAFAEELANGIFSHKEKMDLHTFVKWTSKHTPRVFSSIYAWISSHIQHGDGNYAGKFIDVNLSKEKEDEKVKLDLNSVWLISSSIPVVFSTSHNWSLLYNSNSDGLSATRFIDSTHKYSGPVLVSMHFHDGQHYISALDEKFPDKSREFGGFNSRIVRMTPAFYTYHNVKGYVNLKDRHREHGIGFGENPSAKDSAMVWLDGSFDDAMSGIVHNTAGARTPLTLHSVEVWGCGSSDEVKKMKDRAKRDLLAAEQRQMAQRPTSEGWHDSPDRQLLTMAGTLKIDEQSRVSTRKEDM